MCSGDSQLSPPAVCAALLAHLAGKSIPHPPTSWPVPLALCLQLGESTALLLQRAWHSSEGRPCFGGRFSLTQGSGVGIFRGKWQR